MTSFSAILEGNTYGISGDPVERKSFLCFIEPFMHGSSNFIGKATQPFKQIFFCYSRFTEPILAKDRRWLAIVRFKL